MVDGLVADTDCTGCNLADHMADNLGLDLEDHQKLVPDLVAVLDLAYEVATIVFCL